MFVSKQFSTVIGKFPAACLLTLLKKIVITAHKTSSVLALSQYKSITVAEDTFLSDFECKESGSYTLVTFTHPLATVVARPPTLLFLVFKMPSKHKMFLN